LSGRKWDKLPHFLIQALFPFTSNPVAPATGKAYLSQRRGPFGCAQDRPLGWTKFIHYRVAEALYRIKPGMK